MQALVLKRRDWREHDQMISLLTAEKGKVEALAKGVKKIVSKNAAYLEPYFLVEAELIPGKDFFRLGAVVPVQTFKNICADLFKNLLVGYQTKLLDSLLQLELPELKIFKLTMSWLNYLDKTKKSDLILLDAFVIKLLFFLGFDITKVKKLSASQKEQLAYLLKSKWNQIKAYKNYKALHTLVYRFAVYHSEKKLADWQNLLTLAKYSIN